MVTLGVGVPVKHSVGEPVWVEEGHTDSELLGVTDTLLHSDTVSLELWLKLGEELVVPEGQLDKDVVGQ